MTRYPLSIAPMMDKTDAHFRQLVRRISRRALLYTEMLTTQAVLRGGPELLRVAEEEPPIALQLGGDDPEALAECARRAEAAGFTELNLNVGCPSDRVQRGRIGAVLMKSPQDVARAVEAMGAACGLPITVKHRIGVDELDRYEDMLRFVDTVAAAGCARFTVHARKAWLMGLSPAENRSVPPLRYEDVYRLKAERPELELELNGGVLDLDQAESQLAHVDAVMIGRAAYERPFMLAGADPRFFGAPAPSDSERAAVEALVPYIERHLAAGGRLHAVSRHLLGMFAGKPGARRYRQLLSVEGVRPGAGIELLYKALDAVAPDKAEAQRANSRRTPAPEGAEALPGCRR